MQPALENNRPYAAPRYAVISAPPALQERELAKTAALADALAVALMTRGIPDLQAIPRASVRARRLRLRSRLFGHPSHRRSRDDPYVASAWRNASQKKALYKAIADNLAEAPGLRPEDLIIDLRPTGEMERIGALAAGLPPT